VFHERDLLRANGRWRGLDPEYAAPLVDWFLREFRPVTFRPEHARGLRAAMRYRLRGPAGGEWTLTVADGACRVERGGDGRVDVTLVADAEELVAAAQARAAPWVGGLARTIDWIRGPARAEDTVAAITGITSLARGMALRSIRLGGNRTIARRLNRAFWHFWERTAMTEANIAKG
jgi:SCP-2 sterol transfer family protein